MRIVLLLLLTASVLISARPAFKGKEKDMVRGMYIDDFISILGDPQAENKLLEYARANQFTYLALYDLHKVHTKFNLHNVSTSAPLAHFILNARKNYGILQIGAAGENADFFEKVIGIY